MEYLNCGHIAPVLVRGDIRQRLCESNTVVGLLPDITYCLGHFTLQPGDRLLLVTDGLVEAENEAGEMLGDEGLDRIAHLPDIEDILEHVARFQAHNRQQDDCTALQVQYLGLN